MDRTKLTVAGIGVCLVAIAAIIVAIPPDAMLGNMLKLVLFHGATTWANLVTFSLASLLGVAFLITGREGFWRWESAFRTFSAPFWAYNTVMGVISMYLSWGGFNWAEPRMRMTIWVLLAAFGVTAVHMIFERRKLTAALDIVLGTGLMVAVMTVGKELHPDNPIMNSGSMFAALFLGLAVASTAIALLGSMLIARKEESAA